MRNAPPRHANSQDAESFLQLRPPAPAHNPGGTPLRPPADSVRYVFLSATIPNAREFAEWVANTHRQPVNVVYTDYRPTPLEHYLFPAGDSNIYLVVDKECARADKHPNAPARFGHLSYPIFLACALLSWLPAYGLRLSHRSLSFPLAAKFREDNFQKAIGFIAANSGAAAASRDMKQAARDGKKEQAAQARARAPPPSVSCPLCCLANEGRRSPQRTRSLPVPPPTPPQGPSDIFKLVRMLMERNYDPVIIFSFSKRECETLSLQMNKLDLTGPDEKKVIDTIFNNAMEALNDDDRRLPQVVHMLPLLRRGIGVHHSGLLPIVKEARAR